MTTRDPYDEPTTGTGDPSHTSGKPPTEPVTTGSGDPQHQPGPAGSEAKTDADTADGAAAE